MIGGSWYARYNEAQRRRVLAMMTNPLWIGIMMALTWIFLPLVARHPVHRVVRLLRRLRVSPSQPRESSLTT
jgi:hypothetical protein